MWNTARTDGVCPACRFGSGCIYEAAAKRRILQCEQFEPAIGPAPLPAAPADARAAAADRSGNRLAGLCSNCEFRDDCIYPKPEGGVWRCEEYR